MRFLLLTVTMAIIASTLGCATCGNPLSCCGTSADCCAIDCCTSDCCLMECESCTAGGCDTCCPGCGIEGYELVYDGPAIPAASDDVSKSAANTNSDCVGHIGTNVHSFSQAPMIAAPANSTASSVTQPKRPTVFTSDQRPSATMPQSILRAPTPAVPSPEPKHIETTKPAKNFLPGILPDEA